MSKTVDEVAAEMVAAALASGQLRTESDSAPLQAEEIASAFKRIRDAVASQPKRS